MTIYNICYTIGIVFFLPAVYVWGFEALRNDKSVIHRHLAICCIFENLCYVAWSAIYLWTLRSVCAVCDNVNEKSEECSIAYKSAEYQVFQAAPATSFSVPGSACYVGFHLFKTAKFYWMLIEAINTYVLCVYNPNCVVRMVWYYLLGYALPFLLTVAWLLATLFYDEGYNFSLISRDPAGLGKLFRYPILFAIFLSAAISAVLLHQICRIKGFRTVRAMGGAKKC